MKAILFSIGLTIFSFTHLTAQQEQVVDKMVESSCTCLSDMNLDNISENEFQSEFQTCVMKYVMANLEQIQNVFSAEENGDMMTAMTSLGKKVWQKLLKQCPTTLTKITGMEIDELKMLGDSL
jgi:hypothetical protein